MTMKEISKITGLSSKTIRFYEAKELIQVNRKENNYREYDESCIEQLQMIRFLRAMGIFIAKIKSYVDGHTTLEVIIQQQYDALKETQLKTNVQCELIEGILKKVVSKQPLDLSDGIASFDEIESEEFTQFYQAMEQIQHHSIAYYIIMTLILSGPIMWLFFHLSGTPVAYPIPLGIMSIICIILLTLLWQEYLRQRKQYPEKKKGGWMILLMGLGIFLLALFCIYCVGSLQEWMFLEEGYRMWTMPRIYTYGLFLFMIEALIFAGSKVYERTQNIDMEVWQMIWNWIKKHRKGILVANLLLFYICIFNCDVVYQDRIEVRRWYAPISQTYTLEDIDYVETGFYQKQLFTQRSQGEFYYRVVMKEGREIDLSQPTPNKEKKYEEHTYLEIEEFDDVLMKLGIPKKQDETYYEYNDLDQEFKERFLRIVRNAPKEKAIEG